MKDKYEISLWEDYLVVDTDHQPDDPDFIPTHYEEKKICVIGSDSMTASYRAYAPELKSEINGTHTLTFKMYYTIKEDEITVDSSTFTISDGKLVVNGHTSDEQRTPTYSTFDLKKTQNPFLGLLVNERKVKCKWKNKWYDFVIKNCREDSNGKSITYTCTDLFINELSKNGFSITLDAELENNMGTVTELASTILDGTDWNVDEANSDTIQQEKEEPVYEINLINGWTLKDQTAGIEDVQVFAGSKVLVFYQQIQELVSDLTKSGYVSDTREIQFAYAATYETDKNSQLVTNAHCYGESVLCQKSTYQGVDCIVIGPESAPYMRVFYKSSVSNRYRASRLVKQPVSILDPLTGKYCNVLKARVNDPEGYYFRNDEIYEYQSTEWNDALVVNNLVVNSKDFVSNEGWLGDDNLVFQLYPFYTDAQSVDNYRANSYLHLSGGTSFYNAGVRQSSNFIPKGFVRGETYIFRFKARENVTASGKKKPGEHYITGGIEPIVCTYKDEGAIKVIDDTKPVYLETITDYPEIKEDNWVEWKLRCINSVTRLDIYQKKVGLFLMVSNGNECWLEEAQLFKEVYGADNTLIYPGDIDVQSVCSVKYFYYNHSLLSGLVTNPDDIIYLRTSETKWNDGNRLERLYNQDPISHKDFVKIRSITAKQSNRFNLIQTLAQTFECWAQFIIEHDENTGKTIYVKGIPQKTVCFKKDIGKETGIGFVYGIDLKGINRTIQSDNIVTKTIVTQNSNEFATNGFCTISRSKENYPRTNFILNFDYYISQGLLDGNILNNDLYDSTGDIGYYYWLNQWNTEYDEITEFLSAKNLELSKQVSYQTVYDEMITSLQEEITNIQGELERLAGVTSWADATTWIKANADQDQVRSRMTALKTQEESLATYQSMKVNLDLSINLLRRDIADKEEQQKTIVDNIKAIDLRFYQKYSRFIQEGNWISEDYIDDNLYYLDAQSVAYTSSRPQIQYDISVIRISSIEEFKNKVFNLGDIAFIQDTEFFGYTFVDGVKTPYKEKVLISEVTSHFDEPEKDTFKVQNYKTQFEDLFQRITSATQSLQYASGDYARAAGIVETNGTISGETLQNSFARNEELVYSAHNESIISNSTGITVSDTTDPNKKTKVTSGGVFITTDGGATWKNAIRGDGVSAQRLTSGSINTNLINIYDGNFPTFRWDESGINAFGKDEQGVDSSRFVRFDHYGVYGVNDPNQTEPFVPSSENDIWNEAKFGMTWRGFFIKNKYDTHSVEITSTDDIRVMKQNIEMIKIGRIYHDPSEQNPDIFGIRISDGEGAPVMETDSTGKLWLKNRLDISSTNSTYNIGIGYLNAVKPSTSIHEVFNAHSTNPSYGGEFIIYEDGSMKATSGEFTGTIYATGGRIGNMTIEEVEESVYRAAVESNSGTVFKNGEGSKILTAKLYMGTDEVTQGTFTYTWYLNGVEKTQYANYKSIEVSASAQNQTYVYSCEIGYDETQPVSE